MIGTNDKLRSLFLAALMVFSVFAGTVAFSGTAAAANEVAATSAVEYDSGNVEIVFSRSADTTAGDLSTPEADVYVDGQQVIDDGADQTGGSYSFSSVELTSDSYEFSIGQDITPNRNLTIVLENVEPSTNGDATDIVQRDITVTSNDVTESGGDLRAYKGEKVAIVASSDNTDVVIDGPDGIELDGSTDSNSEVLPFSTSGLSTGSTYEVDFGGNGFQGAQDVNFTVNNLKLSASAQATDITTNQNIVVDVSAIRGGEPVTAVVTASDGSTFAANSKKLSGSGNAQFSFGLSEGDAGDYTVTVTDNKTGISKTTDTISVTEAADADVSIANVQGDQRGDVANITLELTSTQYATVTLGNSGDAFVSNVTVQDTDGDGTVHLEWNTFLADDRGANNHGVAAAAPGADSQWSANSGSVTETNVSTQISQGPGHIISAGTYDLEASTGQASAGAVQANANDVSMVTLTSRDSSSVDLWTAPAGTNLGSLSNIADAQSNGQLTETGSVAVGDQLVVEVSAQCLEGAFQNQSSLGFNNTASWLNMTDNQTVFLNHTEEILQGSNESPNSIIVSEGGTGATGITVVPNPDDDSYYIVHDSSKLSATAGETYNTEFKIPAYANNQANFGLVAPNSDGNFIDETATSSFDVTRGRPPSTRPARVTSKSAHSPARPSLAPRPTHPVRR